MPRYIDLPLLTDLPAGSSVPVILVDNAMVRAPASLVGGGGGTAPGYVLMIAGAAVLGHRALMFDGSGGVVHADPASAGYVFAGVSMGAAAIGTAAQVATAGASATEPSWSWVPGQPVYVGAGGALTQVLPTSGVFQQVAVAISASSLLVQPFPPIILNRS